MPEQQPEQQPEQIENARFSKISIKFCHCFGGYKSNNSWLTIAEKSISEGWKNIDCYTLENNLADDVNKSYTNIATIEIVDLATDVQWIAKYINDKSLWKLEIKDSPSAEVLDEDRQAFFTSKDILKLFRDCGDLLDKSREQFDAIVKQHLEKAELLEVDEVKLSAILFWLNDKMFMENFRLGKFIM